jgi:hypothetical protein
LLGLRQNVPVLADGWRARKGKFKFLGCAFPPILILATCGFQESDPLIGVSGGIFAHMLTYCIGKKPNGGKQHPETAESYKLKQVAPAIIERYSKNFQSHRCIHL